MKFRIVLSLPVCLLLLQGKAQIQGNLSSSEILLELQKLNVLGRVLYIAAHPDDENTRLLSHLAKERKCRTAYLSITRGEGGQNLIGKEQGTALGVLRTQELLAARRVDGAEQYFTNAVDFGYSKNPEETFTFWNKEKTLADVVYLIRKFRPDVIICRFPTTGEGGHGHHTASAILAQEAFDAAADSTQYPEQLRQTSIWKTRRLFWNTFNFSSGNTTSPDQLQLDVGVYNRLLGKSYGEIASESRSCHKSQGFGVARQRGKNIEYFKLLRGDSVKRDLLEGITLSWSRWPEAEQIQSELKNCIENFRADLPELSVPGLLRLYKALEPKQGEDEELRYWKINKRPYVEKLLLSCSGLWLEASAADYRAVPGKELQITSQLISRCHVPVKLISIQYPGDDTLCDLDLQHNNLYTFKRISKVDSSILYSDPYWLNTESSGKIPEGSAERDADLYVVFRIKIREYTLAVKRPLIYKFTDPVKGEVYRALEVLPPATVNSKEQAFVFANSSAKIISFTVKANTENIRGKLELFSSKGWKVDLPQSEFVLEKIGDEQILEARVRCEESAGQGTLTAFLWIGDKKYGLAIQRIEYDHIPYQFLLSEARYTLVNAKLKTNTLKLAYLEGAGDDIPSALKQIGLDLTPIKAEDLPKTELAVYDAIITGIRAYNTSKSLLEHNAKLLEFVKEGGNLLVQYNTNNNIGQLKNRIGPYPFTISRERITDEKARVNFVLPKHPALTHPNKLDSSDFENWVQERGIYFASELDLHYACPISMQDPGEKEKSGALIIAPYGKGNYIYTGLSFFRQLPAGVPGAYRLFVNLLNLPKH